jgi:hypothetical protein
VDEEGMMNVGDQILDSLQPSQVGFLHAVENIELP